MCSQFYFLSAVGLEGKPYHQVATLESVTVMSKSLGTGIYLTTKYF